MTMMATPRKLRLQTWFALVLMLPVLVSSFAPRSQCLVQQPHAPLQQQTSALFLSKEEQISVDGKSLSTDDDDDDEDASSVSSVLDDLSNKVSALQALAKEQHQPTGEALEKHIQIVESTLKKVGQKLQQDFQAVNQKLATLEEEKSQQESKMQDAFKGFNQTLRSEMETMEAAYQQRCLDLEIAMRQRVHEVEEEIDTWDRKLIDEFEKFETQYQMELLVMDGKFDRRFEMLQGSMQRRYEDIQKEMLNRDLKMQTEMKERDDRLSRQLLERDDRLYLALQVREKGLLERDEKLDKKYRKVGFQVKFLSVAVVGRWVLLKILSTVKWVPPKLKFWP
jgi:hypothetical protein